jgi:hypothetical protein
VVSPFPGVLPRTWKYRSVGALEILEKTNLHAKLFQAEKLK